jgi:uncharacterized protein DUF2784
MLARIGADAVLLVHFAFIVFVLLGGLLVLRSGALAWLHLPAVAWAVFVEATGRICPLTYVENALRARAGLAGYRGDFLSHYLLQAIYPAGIMRGTQALLAVIVVAVNAAIYVRWLRQRRARGDAAT